MIAAWYKTYIRRFDEETEKKMSRNIPPPGLTLTLTLGLSRRPAEIGPNVFSGHSAQCAWLRGLRRWAMVCFC
jgi:hypothetical protein